MRLRLPSNIVAIQNAICCWPHMKGAAMCVFACNHLQWCAVLSVKQLATLTHCTALMYCTCRLASALATCNIRELCCCHLFDSGKGEKMHYFCYSSVCFCFVLPLLVVAVRALLLLQHLTSLLCLAPRTTAASIAIATLTMHKQNLAVAVADTIVAFCYWQWQYINER